ncbi:MAG: hypothetical protein ACP5GU_03570 [Thermoprotei archaeon]|jgi:hypothetical protein
MKNLKNITPIYGQGFFTVSNDGLFTQIIVFDYYDPEHYYLSILEDEDKYEDEMQRLIDNMQGFLNEEEILINGIQVQPVVVAINLEHRGEPENPIITFIINFKGALKYGMNTFENHYEPEILDYDYTVYWIFPPNMKIVKVEPEYNIDILNNNILIISGHKGEKVDGFERIMFKINKPRTKKKLPI